MMQDEREWWNDIWASEEEMSSTPDEILVSELGDMLPGRALEIGCGAGANAVWLAQRGWEVTAVDFSDNAIARGQKLAADQGVRVDFTVADATTYQPEGQFDLIISFYIQLFPQGRATMLATAAAALALEGTLLFVSHDASGPPPDWEEEFLSTLTTPEQVVAEIPALKVEKAYVHDAGADGPHASHADEHEHHDDSGHDHDHGHWLTTVVRAVKIV